MKLSIYLFTLLLMGTLFVSCDKSDINYENDFDKSYKAWENFKASSQNSYRYMVVFGSWTGYGTETIITVKNGQVTGRSFVGKGFVNGQNTTPTVVEEWTEDESSINTHEKGAAAITLDEIYNKAKTDYLLKRDDARTYFETNNNGMISSCGYTPENCADDCFNGVTIQYIEKL
ncbi:hypothetical protein F0L74_15125 [Chitinophaga agrisoli]|uniref:Heme-binding HmuY-like protein n=1 Tax=Chitinophaga agrisoli TaxID=2607653 RepID=A0A5B2VXN9_9BACT|nr:hypothetical protein [Chitinophaga agrisoli]KAA2243805.1 hypothetical protein F0L74_15125 [Chitinophaga agrisoli]